MDQPEDKRQLRDYLKTLDLRNAMNLEARAEEIVGHVRRIMEPYVAGLVGEPLRAYYAPALAWIEKAYTARDFTEEFPHALDFMIDSVDWE